LNRRVPNGTHGGVRGREIHLNFPPTRFLVAGGDKSHIGAVAIMDESKKLTSITFPKHKETIIAETWARQLYEKFNMPVVVSAGIHYDKITPNDILCVVKATNMLLETV